MRLHLSVLIAGFLLASSVWPAPALAGGHSRGSGHGSNSGRAVEPPRALSAKQLELHDTMRKLWEDHVTWTRLFIVSAVHSAPNVQATTARLLKNQADLGDAIRPFYGNAAGDQLSSLLTEHILIAAEITSAAAQGDTAAVNDAVARWYANADQIAAFLSAANPKNWPAAEMRAMMREHLDLTLKEAVEELQGDYSGSVDTYDEIHGQILEMADMLSRGIIRQFPNKVR